MSDQPKDMAEWKAQAAANALFRQMEDEAGEADRMLERDETNRIVTAEQARGLMVLETQAEALGEPFRGWIRAWSGAYQDWQLTIGAPENSRLQFARIAIAKVQSRASGLFDRFFGRDDK